MSKYLIINADDFGMCHSANEAILDLFESGCIKSTTMMVCCPWAKEAVRLCKEHPEIKVGLHVTHTAEWENYRWRPISDEVGTLKDSEGYFYSLTAPLLEAADPKELMIEMEAQVAWLRNQGISFTHLDNHMMTLQKNLQETIEYCAKEGFSFRMDRFGNRNSGMSDEEYQKTIEYADAHKVGIIDYLNANADRFPNDRETYESIRDSYVNMLRNLPEGVNEFFTHPAKESDELKAIAPDWKVRINDYRFLKDPLFKEILEEEKITLIGWDDVELLCSASVLKK